MPLYNTVSLPQRIHHLFVVCWLMAWTLSWSAASADSSSIILPEENRQKSHAPKPDHVAKPNIVLILFDDLGYSDLDLEAYARDLPPEARIHTPHLKRLAEEGAVLTDYSTDGTVCSPTRASLLTGIHPAHLGFFRVASSRAVGIPQTVPTLPRVLTEQGYFNAHVGKWHLGWGREHFLPKGLGFQEVTELLINAEHQGKALGNDHQDRVLRVNGQRTYAPGLLSQSLVDRTIEVLKARSKEPETPFFLNLWLYAPHLPLDGGSDEWLEYYGCDALEKGKDRCLYAAMVSTVDAQIGRVLDTLDELGMRENTLVVVTSDNGGAWEPAHPEMRSGPQNGPLLGHKHRFFEGGIRVPLIARFPGKIPPGTQGRFVTRSSDLMPTILEAAGIAPLSGSANVLGTSFWDALTNGTERPQDEPLFWVGRLQGIYFNPGQIDSIAHRFAVRHGPWKLLYDVDPGYSDNAKAPRLRLFDLRKAPAQLERANLIQKHPETARRLWDAYWDWLPEATRIPLEFQEHGDRLEIVHDDRFDLMHGAEFTLFLDVPPFDSDNPQSETLLKKPGVFELLRNQKGRLFLHLATPQPSRLIAPASDQKAQRVAITFRHRKARKVTSVDLYVDGVRRGQGTLSSAPPEEQSAFIVGNVENLDMYNILFVRDQIIGRTPAMPGVETPEAARRLKVDP